VRETSYAYSLVYINVAVSQWGDTAEIAPVNSVCLPAWQQVHATGQFGHLTLYPGA